MLEKKKLSQIAYKLAWEYEQHATNCCQSAIAALQDAIDFVPHSNELLKAGSAFAGGLAFSNQASCGALVGSVMVFGLLYGRSRAKFEQHQRLAINEVDYVHEAAPSWDLAYELYEKFVLEYGSPLCKDVMTHVYGANPEKIRPDGRVAYEWTQRFGGHESGGCCGVVASAVKWATEMILREGPPPQGKGG